MREIKFRLVNPGLRPQKSSAGITSYREHTCDGHGMSEHNCSPSRTKHCKEQRPQRLCTSRYREQYFDDAVTLDTQRINNEDTAMDKDRIKGSTEQAKGAMKETAGKVFGDKKLETEGKTDKAAGKVQNAVGGLKDAMRGK